MQFIISGIVSYPTAVGVAACWCCGIVLVARYHKHRDLDIVPRRINVYRSAVLQIKH